MAALVPIGALCLVLGLYPQPFFDVARKDLKVVADIAAGARERDEARRQASQNSDPQTAARPEEAAR